MGMICEYLCLDTQTCTVSCASEPKVQDALHKMCDDLPDATTEAHKLCDKLRDWVPYSSCIRGYVEDAELLISICCRDSWDNPPPTIGPTEFPPR